MNERVEATGLSDIFSRKIKAALICATPMQCRIEADAAERAALAEIFGLPAIASLTGEYDLVSPRNSGMIEATLDLAAKVTQICVVSLEPFEAKIAERACLRFVPAAGLHEDFETAGLDPESLEAPDELPFAGDAIDLGAALAEQLALALDPYPRKPGAQLPASPGAGTANPFAVLAARRSLPANDPE